MYLCQGRHYCSLYLRVHWCTFFALASYKASCFGFQHTVTCVCRQRQQRWRCAAEIKKLHLTLLLAVDAQVHGLDCIVAGTHRVAAARVCAQQVLCDAAGLDAMVNGSCWAAAPCLFLGSRLVWWVGLSGAVEVGLVGAKYKACPGRIPALHDSACSALHTWFFLLEDVILVASLLP
jgi:hypothetical protein